MIITPLHRFRTMALEKQAPLRSLVQKDYVTTVEDMDDRKVRFTISTANVDRDGDTLAADGWMLDEFKTDPVVLWSHRADLLPIGRVVEIGSNGAALKALVEFVPADMPERGSWAEAVLRMCRTGFLSATSVGFHPVEYEIAKDRMDQESWFAPIDFKRQTLRELSIVTIPANAEALIDPGEREVATSQTVRETIEQLAADEAVQKAADTEPARVAVIHAARRARQLNARLVAAA